jgi:hypothetical protein
MRLHAIPVAARGDPLAADFLCPILCAKAGRPRTKAADQISDLNRFPASWKRRTVDRIETRRWSELKQRMQRIETEAESNLDTLNRSVTTRVSNVIKIYD